jgi:HTH-type transcriptional regulator / antitoxin MqsA
MSQIAQRGSTWIDYKRRQRVMFKCQVCGSSNSHTEYVSEVFNINGKFHLVESIPATVCDGKAFQGNRWGEELFSRETTERIRVMLHGQPQPVRSVSLDVFSFDEAV